MTNRTALENLDLYLGQRMPYVHLHTNKLRILPETLLERIVDALDSDCTKKDVNDILKQYVRQYATHG
jgi:hypothetical protein